MTSMTETIGKVDFKTLLTSSQVPTKRNVMCMHDHMKYWESTERCVRLQTLMDSPFNTLSRAHQKPDYHRRRGNPTVQNAWYRKLRNESWHLCVKTDCGDRVWRLNVATLSPPPLDLQSLWGQERQTRLAVGTDLCLRVTGADGPVWPHVKPASASLLPYAGHHVSEFTEETENRHKEVQKKS